MKLIKLTLILGALNILNSQANAFQTININTDKGHKLFEFLVYDKKGENTNPEGKESIFLDKEEMEAARDMTPEYLQSIVYAGKYWADILGDGAKNTTPIKINIANTELIDNAYAESDITNNGMTDVQNALINNEFAQDESQGKIRVGAEGYTGQLEVLTHIINKEQFNITSTLFHEVAHALGIASNRGSFSVNKETNELSFGDKLSAWDSQLVDSRGKQAQPHMLIEQQEYTKDCGENTFCITEKEGNLAFLQGKNIAEVLAGTPIRVKDGANPNKIAGVPVNGYEGGFPEMSHLEPKFSVLSHQNFDNYNTPMEVELAALQDLGYQQIKRRKFFGRSIYGNANNIVNQVGFNELDADGNYILGTYNKTLAGIGLHVYGDNNKVVQQGDILAEGFGATGIRVDGESNNLEIQPEILIDIKGEKGTGVMFTYGSKHNFFNHGTILANGRDGVGVRFDFGDSGLGNSAEYRGSYMFAKGNKAQNLDTAAELKAALVNDFVVTGQVSGDKAAIFMSANAFVEQINFMQGSKIDGDIISEWNPDDERIQLAPDERAKKITELNFGVKKQASGYLADNQFIGQVIGNIAGRKGLNVNLKGGQIDLIGDVDSVSFNVAPQASFGFIPNTKITADTINLPSDSKVRLKREFSYAPRDEKTLNKAETLLTLEAEKITNKSEFDEVNSIQSNAIYDYAYTDVKWNKSDHKSSLLTSGLAYEGINAQRAGFDALISPLIMFAHNNTTGKLNDQVRYRFQPNLVTDLKGNKKQFQNGELNIWLLTNYTDLANNNKNYAVINKSVLMGVDKFLTGSLFAGVALNASQAKFNSNDAVNTANDKSLTIYGGVDFRKSLTLGINFGLGNTRYKQNRNFNDVMLNSDYSANYINLGMSFSKMFKLTDKTMLTGFIEPQYSYLYTNGFNEKNNKYALSVNATKFNLFRLKTGLDALYKINPRTSFNIKAYYSGFYNDTSRSATVSFVADPQVNQYSFNTYSIDKHFMGLDLMLNFKLKKNIDLFIETSLLKGAHTNISKVNLGLQGKF